MYVVPSLPLPLAFVLICAIANPKGGGKVFGRPLAESVNNPDGSELPNIVLKCVAYIEKNGMSI
mgnify:CR=1 FL=1